MTLRVSLHAVLLLALLIAPLATWAAPADEVNTVVRRIPLRYISPATMLEPGDGAYSARLNAIDGITRIVGLNGLNSLLVTARDAEAMEHLVTLVKAMDTPQSLFIDYQFLRCDEDTAAKLGVHWREFQPCPLSPEAVAMMHSLIDGGALTVLREQRHILVSDTLGRSLPKESFAHGFNINSFSVLDDHRARLHLTTRLGDQRTPVLLAAPSGGTILVAAAAEPDTGKKTTHLRLTVITPTIVENPPLDGEALSKPSGLDVAPTIDLPAPGAVTVISTPTSTPPATSIPIPITVEVIDLPFAELGQLAGEQYAETRRRLVEAKTANIVISMPLLVTGAMRMSKQVETVGDIVVQVTCDGSPDGIIKCAVDFGLRGGDEAVEISNTVTMAAGAARLLGAVRFPDDPTRALAIYVHTLALSRTVAKRTIDLQYLMANETASRLSAPDGAWHAYVPDGVREVVPIPGTNQLLARADSEAALDMLTALLKLLDQPMRSVAIQVQMVQMSDAAAKSLPSPHEDAEAFRVKLQALIEAKKAKLLSSPLMVVQNSGTAGIGIKGTPTISTRVTQCIIHPDDTVTVGYRITLDKETRDDILRTGSGKPVPLARMGRDTYPYLTATVVKDGTGLLVP